MGKTDKIRRASAATEAAATDIPAAGADIAAGPATLAGIGHSELVIRKSRFIGCVQPVADRAAAQAIVAALWQRHPAATHVCWALLAGGHSAAVDDGEPGGTAGRPMLDVLRHQDLEGVLATAVRYYGGIQLGTGGLVRAYTDCVVQALQGVARKPRERLVQLRCRIPYAMEGSVRRAIDQLHARLVSVSHDETVQCCIELADAMLPTLRQRLEDATQGRIEWLEPEK